MSFMAAGTAAASAVVHACDGTPTKRAAAGSELAAPARMVPIWTAHPGETTNAGRPRNPHRSLSLASP
jgi:hypothetical protein